MAKSVLDIVIRLSKQGGADKETITGLVQLKSAIMEAAAVAGTLVAAGYTIKKAFDETVGVMVDYADQVRSIAQLSGLSAEESSKLIQVTDDLKISQEDLLKVMQKNGDQYDYSVSGLAAMSDQYLALGSSQEKAAFMQERFGKSWGNFVELMEQGSKRIESSADNINKALILDQKALDSAREYERQIDSLADSWMAFKVAAGSAILPETVSFLQRVNAEIEEENGQLFQGEKAWRMWLGPIGAAWNAIDFFTNSTDASVVSMNNADAARLNGLASLYTMTNATNEYGDAATTNYEQVLGVLEKVNKAQTTYSESVLAVNNDMTLSDSERIAKLGELSAEYQKATYEIVAANMLQIMSQDGLTQAEFARYVAFQEGTGLMTAGAAQQAIALNKLATEAANGTMSVEQLKAAIAGLNDKTVTITVNTVGSLYSTYGDSARVSGSGARRARGTNGWETVPAGFPGDTFPVWMSTGEQFAVIPPGGSGGNVSTSGVGGGNINLTVNISSMINTADRERVKSEMLPVITEGIRSLQGQGLIR